MEVKRTPSEYYPIGSPKSVAELSGSARWWTHSVESRKEPYNMKRQKDPCDGTSEATTKPLQCPN